MLPKKYLHYYLRPMCKALLLSAGQFIRTKGTAPAPSGEPYLYMINHESMFDHFMLGASCRHYVTGVGAYEQLKYPLYGAIVKKYGMIPIVRKELGKAIHSLNLAEDAIRNGISFLISPEGTRTLSREMGPFKKGPFHISKNTGVTIIPVGLTGVYDAKKKSDWRLKPGIITLHYGEPIYGTEYENLTLEALQNLVRNRIKTLITNPA
ncbi:MAG: 1-acyl-sn-glycerol-3-phosphate acyltransferase [Candidatus Marinimicrobia bacterium]|nr:1-acyl-sn-glycerol-3-phosphate acyltransferase [Candidatus Neomarinimicrobiota bacterium]